MKYRKIHKKIFQMDLLKSNKNNLISQMSSIKLFILGNNFFLRKKINIIFLIQLHKKVYGNYLKIYSNYQINITNKNRKFCNKKIKKIMNILSLKNSFNKFLMISNKIGNKRKLEFKKNIIQISKLHMKKVMKNIIYGMIKKQKMK